jgi:Ser/Thr protein kinase RdoA (MazF antagonist)
MNQAPDLRLDRNAAASILDVRPTAVEAVDFLRGHNHSWRISVGDDTYFLKAHTKDWYADACASGLAVRHEITGGRTLRSAGLPAAEVVTFSAGTANPLGWPYLVTRRLPGTPLPELLSALDRGQARSAIEAVGGRLAAMHDLTFDHPGYLIDGPPTAPDPDQWLHWLSKPERFLLYFFQTLTADAADVTLRTRDTAAALFETTLPRLREAYVPLRFVHGDCHAGVFHLDRADSGWQVTGVLDLENCSAGSPHFDLVKLFIELVARVGPLHQWWRPLFRGYGREPDFDLIRLLMIGHAHVNYSCHGRSHWPVRRQDVLDHLLGATTWADLFDPN